MCTQLLQKLKNLKEENVLLGSIVQDVQVTHASNLQPAFRITSQASQKFKVGDGLAIFDSPRLSVQHSPYTIAMRGARPDMLPAAQVEHKKYEGRIVALQRARQEAVSKAEFERTRAQDLEQEVERLLAEKIKCAARHLQS
jgi:hypothetical protein